MDKLKDDSRMDGKDKDWDIDRDPLFPESVIKEFLKTRTEREEVGEKHGRKRF